MDRESTAEDPRRIRSLAVTAADAVTALEANERRDVAAVLRVTPPYAGRMRARLHRAGGEGDYDEPAPLHLDPSLFAPDAPPYPTPDATEDELRARDAYTPERHRRRHVRAVEAWRRAVRRSLVDSVALPAPDGAHRVDVAYLG